jgi:hypothetical protein
MRAPVNAGRTPLTGSVVQVVLVAPIGRGRTRDAVDADALGRQWEGNLMVPAGHSPRGLVHCLMFVSLLPVWEHIDMCVACGPLTCPAPSAVPVAKIMYLELS